MIKNDNFLLRIETPAVGMVELLIPYNSSKDEKGDYGFIIDIPRRHFFGTDYTRVDLTHLIEDDIEHFKKLNARNDERHQVYIDTLRVEGMLISGNYVRMEYTFNQDGDPESHRMCSGQLAHASSNYKKNDMQVIWPSGYSSDVCVYW